MARPVDGAHLLLPGRPVNRTLAGALDPRVAILCLFIADTALLTVGTEVMEVAGVGVAALCLVAARRPLAAGFLVAAEALLLVLVHLVLPDAAGTAEKILATVLFAGGLTLRFVIAGVIAWVLVGGITTGALQAALGWARVPRVLAVPAIVAVRFLPVVVDDARALRETLVLRGVVRSGAALFFHPVTAVRHAVLPLVASSLRTGDEIAASALLRGLGGHRRPTSVVRLRLGAVDVIAVLLTAAVVALALKESVG